MARAQPREGRQRTVAVGICLVQLVVLPYGAELTVVYVVVEAFDAVSCSCDANPFLSCNMWKYPQPVPCSYMARARPLRQTSPHCGIVSTLGLVPLREQTYGAGLIAACLFSLHASMSRDFATKSKEN